LSDFPYAFKDRGVFDDCKDFTSSIPKITVNFESLDETTNFEAIKTYLYTTGPLIGYFMGIIIIFTRLIKLQRTFMNIIMEFILQQEQSLIALNF